MWLHENVQADMALQRTIIRRTAQEALIRGSSKYGGEKVGADYLKRKEEMWADPQKRHSVRQNAPRIWTLVLRELVRSEQSNEPERTLRPRT